MDHDPFAAFPSSDDDDDDDNKKGPNTRHAECGLLAFHQGTEESLWQFVSHELHSTDSSTCTTIKNATEVAHDGHQHSYHRDEDLPKRILDLIDCFCFSRHWMMHIGPEKGSVLEGFLEESLDSYFRKLLHDSDMVPTTKTITKATEPFIVVELGTYCGYSLIRMIRIMLRRFAEQPDHRAPHFHLFTVDVSRETVRVAEKLVQACGLGQFVTFLILTDPTAKRTRAELSTILRDAITDRYPNCNDVCSTINFLFIDHDKNAYLPDIQQLERQGLIRAGSCVAADNVIFFQIDGYRRHMQTLASIGIVTTRLVPGRLEYVDSRTQQQEVGNLDMQDGIGKD